MLPSLFKEAPGGKNSYFLQCAETDWFSNSSGKLSYTEQAKKRKKCERLTWYVVVELWWTAFWDHREWLLLECGQLGQAITSELIPQKLPIIFHSFRASGKFSMY